MIWGGLVTGASLALAAGAVRLAAGAPWAAAALGAAVFADSAGLQPAPYAMLADMFDYEVTPRNCEPSTISPLVFNTYDVFKFVHSTAAVQYS